jgi:hypothetical protein
MVVKDAAAPNARDITRPTTPMCATIRMASTIP